MPLNNISFNLGQGGVGRPLPGQDYISGLLFYSASLPSGFSTSNRVLQFFSVQDAINAGITNNYSDETAATATLTVTNFGTTGDAVAISIAEYFSKTVLLGTYTKPSTDTTTTLVAAGIAAAINLNKNTTGYSATSAGAVVTITMRPGLGVYPNTGSPASVVYTGGLLAPTSPVATPSTTGGTLASNTYYYKITALDAAGETVGSTEVSATTTGTTSSVALTWTAVSGATSYKIYKGTTSNGENAYFTSGTASFTDTGTAGIAGTVPGSNTTIIAGTLVQPSGGVGSKLAVMYYHISEFFRIQPQGSLYVGIYAVPGSYTFSEIVTMQNAANGSIRQFGVYKDLAAFASADITAIHNQCNTLVGLHKECIALYGADISAVADVSTLPDLSQLTANYCSAVISQDGGAQGASLYYAYGKSITTLGATLGAVAKAKVSQSIAWVGNFNISNGTECDIPAFANNTLYTNAIVTDNYLTNLQNYRYIFLRKFVGVAGSYFNENSTSIAASSPYAYIADNRTIQKATRGIYASVIPSLNSPITLNADGTLSDEAIAYFTGLAEAPLIQMIRDKELSGQKVTINSTQNILSTSKLIIAVSLVEIATGRNIQVNIGFVLSV